MLARHAFPARIGVGKKVADVRLANRAEDGVADGVHQRVRVRMAVEAFRVWNLHAAEDELCARRPIDERHSQCQREPWKDYKIFGGRKRRKMKKVLALSRKSGRRYPTRKHCVNASDWSLYEKSPAGKNW
jgi:hypothetical protein